MRYSKVLTSVLVLCAVIMTAFTLLVTRVAGASSANDTVRTAWQLARLSGSYTFRSDVEQTTPIEPRMSSVGQHSTVNRFVISGTVDESNQQMLVRIENADDSAPPLEIRRDKRKTYTRQGEGDWRELTNVQHLNMTDTLAYLAGVEQIAATQNGRSFDFAFNGNTFADAFRKSLQINASRGVTVNQEWSTITDGEQLRSTNGSGSIEIDSDGLPKQMNLLLQIPQGEEKEAIQARIVTTYTEFARTGLALKQIYNSPLQLMASLMNGNAAQVLYGLWVGVFFFAMISVLVVLLRFRVKLFAPLSLLIIAILLHSPFATVPAKASAAERASAAAATGQQPQPTAVSFDPRVAPEQQFVAELLPPAGTVQAPADSSGAGSERSRAGRSVTMVDSDGDGLSDDQEALIGSDRTKIDTDNDGLSDPQEVQLGTSLTLADTDNDGITDYVEARIPTLNLDTTKSLTPTTFAAIQTQLYTNPLDDDTNSDGLIDGIECPQHMILDNTSVASSITDCADTDGDKTPDFLSNDNDGDGIVDNADFDASSALYGNATTKAGFSDTNPFALRFDGLTPGKPLVVDIQFRPTNPRLLSLNGSVYDWPSSDTAGQIQRTKDTTFAAPKDAAITAMSDVNAANGDMQVSAMLELRVPVSATSFGALPVKPGARWSSATTGMPAWLDTTKTAPYGINAVWDDTGTNVVLTIPVRPITDENGSVVSFAATTYFESQTAEWVNPAKMRLIWLVSMIQDDCPPNLGNCTTAQRIQSFAPVQMYSSEYMVAGISAKEHLGYTAAIVTDDTLSSLQTSTNPYLFITQAKSLITNSFVDEGYLSLTNTSQPTRALDQLLSGTRNQTDPIKTTATRYGITPGTTNIQTFSYATDVASILVRSNDLTNALNTTACRTSASVTSCGTEANKTAVLNTCKTDTTSIRCNPAVIITDESRTRTATLLAYETTGAVSFKESEVVTNRTVEAGFYSVAADGKWTSNDDVQLGTIGIRIQQNIVATSTTYTDISNDTVALLNDAAGVSFVATFMSQSTSTFYGNDLVNAQAVPTYTPTVVPAINTWSGYQSNMLTTYQSGIAKVIALAKYSSNDKPAFELPANLESCTICKGMTALASTIYTTYTNNQKTVADVKLGFRSTSSAIGIAKSIFSVYSFVSDYRKVQNVVKTLKTARGLLRFKSGAAGALAQAKAGKSLMVIGKIPATTRMWNWTKAVPSRVWNFTKSGAKGISTAVKSTKLAKWAAKNAKGLAVAGVVLEVGIEWAMAGMALASARKDYERGNIVSATIGKTVAIILLAVLASAGPIGALISGIIAGIDAIANAICEGIPERDKRSTAGQFLCGGISGLLAKMFTFYNSSLVVDPADKFSFVSHQINNDAGLDVPSSGFRVGNGYHTSFTTRDFMEKMPLPAQFSSLLWFWQWNGINEKSASFAYSLGNAQDNNLGRTIAAGSQVSRWAPSGSFSTPAGYPDLNPDRLKWAKDFPVPAYSTPLTTAGINVKLPDVIYSKANVIPAQTCYTIWIWLIFFPFPLSYCHIENHSDLDSTNLNADSATRFDIFPATIDTFVTLRPKNGDITGNTGYTFGWSSDSDKPAFPAFRDADNDGLTLTQEKTYQTSDALVDTDGDGISDQSEVSLSYPPTVVDGDKDGLTDFQETLYNTDPYMPDTDGDGLMDGEEVVRVENGVRKGGWDVTYAIVGTTPHMTWVSSNPLLADADSDGIIDQREKILGWSPYAKNSPDIISTVGSITESSIRIASVKQSSVYNPNMSQADAAIDGNRDGNFEGSGSVAVTGPDNKAWWQAKLTAATLIDSITVYNRTDCCASRLNSAVVFLTNTDFGTSVDMTANKTNAAAWRTLACNSTAACTKGTMSKNTVTFSPPVSAQFVRIQLNTTDFLQIAEVEITEAKANDLIVRPGDSLVAASTITNKLLGRTQRGTIQYVPTTGRTSIPPTAYDGFMIGPNVSTTTSTSMTIPGKPTVSNGTTTYAQGCAFDGGVLCLRMDDATVATDSMTWNDRSPFSHSVICAGNVCPTVSDATDGWLFNGGTSNDYLTVTPDIAGVFRQNAFTLSLFVKPQQQSVATRPLFTSADNVVRAELLTERPSFTYNGTTITNAAALTIGSWNHLVFRYENGFTSLYTNGVLTARSTGTIARLSSTPSGYLIGGTSAAGSLSTVRDIQLYNRGLTAPQIEALNAGCSDGLMVACLTFTNSSLRDASLAGVRNSVELKCTTGCPTISNGSASFTAPVPLSAGNGVWLEQREFTLGMEFNPPASGTVTYLAASNAASPLTFKVVNAVPTLSYGSQTISTPAVTSGQWNYALIRYMQGTLTLTVYRINNATAPASVVVGTGYAVASAAMVIDSVVEPLNIGSNGALMDAITIHRAAVDDGNGLILAQAALLNQLGRESASAPMSDVLTLSTDVRSTVVAPDATAGRLAVVCTPPSGVAAPVVCEPLYRVPTANDYNYGATTLTQSSNGGWAASSAGDNNFATFNHTATEFEPWIQLDLGSNKRVRTVTIVNRQDCCPERLTGAVVLLRRDGAAAGDDTTTNLLGNVNTVAARSVACTTAATVACGTNPGPYQRIDFGADFQARYVRIQLLNRTNYLHVAEIILNDDPATLSTIPARAPDLDNGAMKFAAGDYVSLSNAAAQRLVKGAYTMTFRVKFTNTTANTKILHETVRGSAGANLLFDLYLADRRLYLDYASNRTATSVQMPFVANRWYDIAIRQNANATFSRDIFINGVNAVGLASAPGDDRSSEFTKNYLQRAHMLRLGGDGTNATPFHLSNFQIHASALTDTTIQSIATEPSTELQLPFDEPGAPINTTSSFASVQTADLTVSCASAIGETSCPTSGVPGIDGAAVRFNGSQTLKFPSDTSLFAESTLATNRYTVGMWIKPTRYDMPIIGGTASAASLRIRIDATGRVTYARPIMCGNRTTKCWPTTSLTSREVLPLDRWSYITVGTNGAADILTVNGGTPNTRLTPLVGMDFSSTTATAFGMNVATTNPVGGASAGTTAPTITNIGGRSALTMTSTSKGLFFGTAVKYLDPAQRQFTLGGWFYPTSCANAFLAERSGVGTLAIYLNKYQFTSNTGWLDSTVTCVPNTWQYIGVSYNGATVQTMIRSSSASSWTTKDFASSVALAESPTWPFFVGQYVTAHATWPRYQGAMDDVALYDEVLSTTDLEQSGIYDQNMARNEVFAVADGTAVTSTSRATLIGMGYVGDMDDLRILPYSASNAQIAGMRNAAPRWNLQFEQNIETIAPAVTVNGTSVQGFGTTVTSFVPDIDPARAGGSTIPFRATCLNTGITGLTCPSSGDVGQSGNTSTFNGTTSMLLVNNPKTLYDDLAAGGTVRLMIKPTTPATTQTIFSYDDGTTIGMRVSLVGGKVQIKIGSATYTAATQLAASWNQLSFSYGAGGFRYYQNGILDTSVTTTVATTVSPSLAMKFTIGGRLSGMTIVEPFNGSIEDISLTPSSLSNAKIYALAYSQGSQGVVHADLSSVVIDADAPTMSIDVPEYTNATPLLLGLRTGDATSMVTNVDVTTTTPYRTTSTSSAPRCTDVTAGVAYCPTFSIDATQTLTKTEGLYGITAIAYDSVDNQRTVTSSIYVDNTAPTVALLSNTRTVDGKTVTTYPVVTSADKLHHYLTLRLSASDPTLANTAGVAGSGVKDVTVTIRDQGGRVLTKGPVLAELQSGTWVAVIDLPFATPTGFYLVDATVRDQQLNTRTVSVASLSNPIEVDASPPRVTLVAPDPYTTALQLVGAGTISGRVSDLNDGRAHLHDNMRVRIDFEAENGSRDFDNRSDSRFVTDCVTCPIIAIEDGRRSARLNVDAPNQSMYVRDAAAVITGTYSIALWAKIAGPGTLISVGGAANPRIRIQSEFNASNSTYKISAKRGTKTIAVSNVPANSWQRILVNEDRSTLLLGVGTNSTTMSVITSTLVGLNAPPILVKNLVIGASYTSASTDAREDYFRGYIDDLVVSQALISPADLDGRDIAAGSGTKLVTSRLVLRQDGSTSGDTLGTSAAAYYTLDETQLPFLDAIAGARSQICNGGDTSTGVTCPESTNGFVGNALVLRESSDGVELNQTVRSPSFTLGMYLKPTSTSRGSFARIEDSGLSIVAALTANMVPTVSITNLSTTASAVITSTVALLPNEWQHLSLSANASATPTVYTLFIDGIAAGTASLSGNFSAGTLIIGSKNATSAVNLAIDDLTLFNRTLTATERSSIVYGFDPVLHQSFDSRTIAPGAIAVDDSGYANSSVFDSSDPQLRNEAGYVGSGALVFDGNDSVRTTDLRGLSMPRSSSEPWSISTWVTKQTSTNASLISATSGLSTTAYSISLVSGRIVVAGLGFTLTAPTTYTAPYHVLVSANGTTATLYINGASVATTAITAATRTVAPYNIAPSRSASATQSTTAAGVPSKAVDNNTSGIDADATTAQTSIESRPWWRLDLGGQYPVVGVNIYNRTDSSAIASVLSNYNIMLSSSTYPADTGTSDDVLRAQSSWFSYQSNPAGTPTNLVPRANTLGRHLSIQLDKTASLGLPEVQVMVAPHVTIGEGFVGSLDDVRVYRRALTPADITGLATMGWKTTTLSERADGYAWAQSAPANTEADVELQAATEDLEENATGQLGEKLLWKGRIDTIAPRIDANTQSVSSTGTYTYSVRVEDRNLDPLMIQTPCGARIQAQLAYPASLWYRGRTAALDGKTIEPNAYEANCLLGETPEVVRRGTFPVANTSDLVSGQRFIYMGSLNRIDILDAQQEDSPVVGTITVPGTVQHLVVNAAKDRLYAISTVSATSDFTLTIFDIAANSASLRVRNTYTIQRTDVPSIAATALTTKTVDGVTNDAYLAILSTFAAGAPAAKISLLNVFNPGSATTGNISLEREYDIANTSFSLAASGDIIAIAQGFRGVTLLRVSDIGTVAPVGTIEAVSFVHKIRFSGDDLLLLDDDEAMTNGIEPTSVNMLRAVRVVQSRDASTGSIELNAPLNDRFQYIYTSPIDADNDETYRIRDFTTYSTGDLMIIGNSSSNSLYSRIAMLDISTDSPAIRADHSFDLAGTRLLVAARNDVMVLAPGTSTTQTLSAFQVSDRRIVTRACDRVGNCATKSATARSMPFILNAIPTTNAVTILNQQAVYTDTTQLAQIRGIAPDGVTALQLFIDNSPAAPAWNTSGSDVQTQVEATFPWTATAGIHEVKAQLTAGATIVTTTPMSVSVDLTAPTVSSGAATIGLRNIIDGMVEVSGVITDDTGLSMISVEEVSSATQLPVTIVNTVTPARTVTTWKAYYLQQDTSVRTISVRISATDRAGRTTIGTSTYTIDTVAPVISAPAFAVQAGSTVTPINAGVTITRTTGVNLVANWAAIIDISAIAATQVDYTVETITQTLKYSLPVTGLRSTALNTREASKITGLVRSRDAVGNESVTPLGTIYVDSATTPDYTPIDSTEPYRGFINRGCAALGTDSRSTVYGSQQFSTTWDEQAVRINWNGANWDADGDLFVYFDSTAGGTVTAYQPTQFTTSITDTIATGNAWMFLPTDMAGRNAARVSPASQTSWMTRLARAQTGARTGTIEGADYALHISSKTDAALMRWDGTRWTATAAPYTLVHSISNGVLHTDIRIPFASIGYTATAPFGLLAVATDDRRLLPWATFPTTNPVRTELGGKKIVITPLLNSYSWPRLSANVCGRTSAQTADNVQIDATLTSSSASVSTRGIADNISNADPNAIAQAIAVTTPICAQIPTEPWCVAAAQVSGTIDAGSTVLQGLESLLVTQQTPRIGSGSVVTYTLTLRNLSTRPSKPIYGVLNTYGGIWITSPNTGTEGIVGGGNYTFHSVQNANQRDYVSIKVNSIPASSTRTILVRTLIDPLKSSASATDRKSSAEIGKLELRLTDSDTALGVDNARTVEWLNSAVRIDSDAPSQIVPNAQTIVRVGKTRISGRVTDDSVVSNVTMQLYSNTSAARTSINCGPAVAGAWQCLLNVPASWGMVYYRVRAADIYGQLSPWTEWYRGAIDRDTPSYALSDTTASMLTNAYLGGTSINLTGVISDASSLAKLVVCDDTQAVCGASATTAGTAPVPETFVQTSTASVPITAQPCNTLDPDSYTRYPLVITDANYLRAINTSLVIKIAHPVASELNLMLKSPSGTIIPLIESPTANTTNLHVRFTDNAATDVTSLTSSVVMTDTPLDVRPSGSMGTFTGEIVRGTWNILTCDTRVNTPSGTIQSATLSVVASAQNLTAGNGSPWTYALTNTAGEDAEPRTIKLWAADTANNLSAARTYTVNIDTVAPQLSVTQVLTQLLSGASGTILSGTVSDGGVIDRVVANVYAGATQISGNSLPLSSATMSGGSTYALRSGRAITVARWELSYTDTTLDPGTYTVQLTAYDNVGNARNSSAYTFIVPQIAAPIISGISMPQSAIPSSARLSASVAPGNGITTVTTRVELDTSGATAAPASPITVWATDGTEDTSVVFADATTLQTTSLAQIAFNGTDVVALTAAGVVTNVIPLASQTQSFALGLTTSPVVQISLSGNHLLALHGDGTVEAVGANESGQITLPTTLGRAVAVAAGSSYSLALLETGEVIGWGSNTAGQTTIPTGARSGVRQIAAGPSHALAIGHDGGVIAWGDSSNGKTIVPTEASRDIIQIATGAQHSLALTSDGRVYAWGSNNAGQTTIPADAVDVIAIYASQTTSAAVTRSGQVIFWGSATAPSVTNPVMLAFTNSRVIALQGAMPTTQVRTIPSGTTPVQISHTFTGLIYNRRYRYSITASNRNGSNTQSGTFITQSTPSTVFLPMLTADSSSTPPLSVTK